MYNFTVSGFDTTEHMANISATAQTGSTDPPIPKAIMTPIWIIVAFAIVAIIGVVFWSCIRPRKHIDVEARAIELQTKKKQMFAPEIPKAYSKQDAERLERLSNIFVNDRVRDVQRPQRAHRAN
ncbi:hypothetical protein BT63DRAFT_452902 [Microthyrium microscopicum]|uniref:Uncharacterized protein n=1 Tax=Microthyrium microscopicum TaxID=703497 RepID=A0A6A6UL49_9PEZI|nr:hypothetical protein BT63DRAFT_452902 [Microthyrium microscopicum]